MKTLLHKIAYSAFINRLIRPFSLGLYKLSKKKIVAISGKISVKTCGLKFSLHVNQTSHVAQHLYYKGASSYEFTPFLADLIKQSNVFFDIGSNIGYFAILASKANPKCKVFAFEPSLGSLHYLRENIRINNCRNIEVISKAVSNRDSQLEFHEIVNNKYPWLKFNLNGSNSLTSEHMPINHRSYFVDVTTLSSVVNNYSLSGIDLIKLDTEYTEHIILENSVDEINMHHPIIISEIYHPIEEQVVSLFNTKIENYLMYQYIQESNTLREIKTFHGIEEDDSNRNFVFCHTSKLGLIQKYITGTK
jgi:FkbM family methyltransferase